MSNELNRNLSIEMVAKHRVTNEEITYLKFRTNHAFPILFQNNHKHILTKGRHM